MGEATVDQRGAGPSEAAGSELDDELVALLTAAEGRADPFHLVAG